MRALTSASSIARTQASRTGASTLVWLCVMVLLWGLSWPATKLALGSISPLWLATIRFGSAAVTLFLYLAIIRSLRFPPRADWPIVASMGFLQMMVFTGLGMIAMTHVDTGRAVLLAYTTPLWGVIASWLLFRDAPTRLQMAALGVGIAGIGLICSPMEIDWTAPGAVLGAAFLLIGAICWSLVIVHIKHHQWTATPLMLAPWQMLIAAVPLAGFAYALEGVPSLALFDHRLMELLLFIGPVATSACFVISAEQGRRISTFAMSNFTLGVPLIGVASSVFFLGAGFSTIFGIGLCLIVAGMLMAAAAGGRKVV